MDIVIVPKTESAGSKVIKPEPRAEVVIEKVEDKKKSESRAFKRPEAPMECLNIGCSKEDESLFEAPEFVISFFNVSKKSKRYAVCESCFNSAIAGYGEMCAALEDHQPLFLSANSKVTDLVEILDSSDEEGSDEHVKSAVPLSEDIVSLVEKELEDMINGTFARVNIQQQIDWNKQILEHKMDNTLRESKELLRKMSSMQVAADKMYAEIQSFNVSHIEEQATYDATRKVAFNLAGESYPPEGPIGHPDELKVNDMFYVAKAKMSAPWSPACLKERLDSGEYRLQLLKTSRKSEPETTQRLASRREMAYGRPPKCRLPVGTRIIALIRTADKLSRPVFYPGIIAEPLRVYNKYQYLVFFDDGYVQYVQHEEVRVVCESSKNVWEDVAPESREFIREYLQQFTTIRRMVQVQKLQKMMTEWQGKWYNAVVVETEGSLVHLYFDELKRYEWLYRGSRRLGPLFRQMQQTKVADEVKTLGTGSDASDRPKRTLPTQAARDTPHQEREKREQLQQQQEEKEKERKQQEEEQKPPEERRSVAKKSSAQIPRPTIQHLNNSTIYVDEDNKPKGKVVYYTAKKHITPKEFTPHECSPSCLFQIAHNLKAYSPLSKPLLSGWERQICKNKIKKVVIYKAPCGRRLRNMRELHHYLRITNCALNVENFDFDYMIHCLAEYVIESNIINKPDISEGTESMAIPCVNYYDNSLPPACIYSAKRVPTEGVKLNLSPEFMCGCDCADDCADKTKCQCWQLTLSGAKYGNPFERPENIGYHYKRLPDPVPTGIYECNANCKCKASCLNRVVQQPLQMKLQVFKTGNRGWGLRCLNDIPKGSFVCCYAGNLLTEQDANEAGGDLGDEYFAELDYIEVVESIKEGYEPDVAHDDDDEDKSSEDEFDPTKETKNKDDSDDEFVCNSNVRVKTRYRTRNSIDSMKAIEAQAAVASKRAKTKDDSSDDEREPINFTPKVGPDGGEETPRRKSIRTFFGNNEAVYIMDAKKTGNIGRYFNVSK